MKHLPYYLIIFFDNETPRVISMLNIFIVIEENVIMEKYSPVEIMISDEHGKKKTGNIVTAIPNFIKKEFYSIQTLPSHRTDIVGKIVLGPLTGSL